MRGRAPIGLKFIAILRFSVNTRNRQAKRRDRKPLVFPASQPGRSACLLALKAFSCTLARTRSTPRQRRANRKTRVANKGWRPNSDSFGNGENRIVKGVLPRAHENSRSYLKVFLKIQVAVSEPSRSSYS